uniref:Uncharacterized protein n=1 Tax=Arundo donax TaxID=35708 RepID=A0A0A8ZN93_ARUDO
MFSKTLVITISNYTANGISHDGPRT